MHSNFKNVKVEGSEYPITKFRRILSYFSKVICMLIILITIFIDKLTDYYSLLPDSIVETMKNKKTMIIIGTFFIGNIMNNMLTSTGAFEVFLNGNKVNYIK